MKLSDSLYHSAGSTWKISQQRLFVLIFEILKPTAGIDESLLFEEISKDYNCTNEKASLEALLNRDAKVTRIGVANKRQQRRKN